MRLKLPAHCRLIMEKLSISGVSMGEVALRSWWDVSENIASGHLVQVLPEYYQPANVWAVYVSRLATSAKVRITVEFLRQYFAEHYPNFSLEHA